jgi:serine/threonine protein kinase
MTLTSGAGHASSTQLADTPPQTTIAFTHDYTIISQQKLGIGGSGDVTAVKCRNEQGQVLVFARKDSMILNMTEAAKNTRREHKNHTAVLGGRVPRCIPEQLGMLNIDGKDVLFSELIDGETISSFISRRHRLHQWEIAVISYGIAIALQHMHRRGMLHCDLKWSNVVLNACRFPFVIDYGSAVNIGTHDESEVIVSATYYPRWMRDYGPTENTPQLDLYCWGLLTLSLLNKCRVYRAKCGASPQPKEGKLLEDVLNDRELEELYLSDVVHPVVKLLYTLAVRCVTSSGPYDDGVPSADSIVAQIESVIDPPLPPSDLVIDVEKFHRQSKIHLTQSKTHLGNYLGLCSDWGSVTCYMRDYQCFVASPNDQRFVASPKDHRFIATNPDPDDYTVDNKFEIFDAIAFACRNHDIADILSGIKAPVLIMIHEQFQKFCLGQITQQQLTTKLAGFPQLLSLRGLYKQPYLSLMCICNYIMRQLGVEELKENVCIRTTIFDTLTKWPLVTPIDHDAVFSMYLNMCLWASQHKFNVRVHGLQDAMVDIPIHEELRSLFTEVDELPFVPIDT